MPYDKYRNWSTEFVNPPRLHRDIKEQVVIDFLEAKEQVDRLEILDSFQAYVERVYRKELLLELSQMILSRLGTPVAGALATFIPEPHPSPRARMIRQEPPAPGPESSGR